MSDTPTPDHTLNRKPCPVCYGSGGIPLPRGMSSGFYGFMAPGCRKRDDGTLLMLCYGCDGSGYQERTP